MKYFNPLNLSITVLLSILSYIFGDINKLFLTLGYLMILDIASGYIKAIYNHKLSSDINFKGLLKKFMTLVIVSLAYKINGVISASIPLRDIVISFYIANEGLSILENAGEFLPLPEKLKNVLLQLRQKGDNEK